MKKKKQRVALYEAIWFDGDCQDLLLVEREDGTFADNYVSTNLKPNGRWVDFLDNGDIFLRLTVIGEL